jgi:hypothetical protein
MTTDRVRRALPVVTLAPGVGLCAHVRDLVTEVYATLWERVHDVIR